VVVVKAVADKNSEMLEPEKVKGGALDMVAYKYLCVTCFQFGWAYRT